MGVKKMGSIVFVSSRQLNHVVDMACKLVDWDVQLLLSADEANSLQEKHKDLPFAILKVDIVKNDGILWEYDEAQCHHAIASLDRTPDAIITFDEGNLELCGRLREHFNIEGPSAQDILPYRSKMEMKRRLTHVGIRTPIWEHLTTAHLDEGYDSVAARLGETLVVKPSSSAGSNNVAIVVDNAPFTKAVQNALANDETYEIEQFIQGKHYHCDTVFSGSECIFAACTEYVGPTVEFQEGSPLGGRALDPQSDISKLLIQNTLPIVQELGVTTVAQHTELIVQDDGTVVFLESGARPPGMLVVQTYERAFGVNLVKLIVSDMCSSLLNRSGQNILAQTQAFTDAFYLVFPKQYGTVQRLNALPEDIKNEVDFELYCGVGDVHTGCHSNLDLTATALSGHASTTVLQTYSWMKSFRPVFYEQSNS